MIARVLPSFFRFKRGTIDSSWLDRELLETFEAVKMTFLESRGSSEAGRGAGQWSRETWKPRSDKLIDSLINPRRRKNGSGWGCSCNSNSPMNYQ